MINQLYWDIDNTLIFTDVHAPNQEHVVFEIDGDSYYTIIRPCAKRLIEFSRELVGKDNVYILTTSTNEYANHVNRLGEFGFDPDHILAREYIRSHHYPIAYGGEATVASDHANINNVLIDNLPPRYNESKTSLIGIARKTQDRYFKCLDYYGVNFPNDSFEEDVKEWLSIIHNQRPIDE